MTPTEAYLAGLATLPAIVLLIALVRPKPTAGYHPPPTAIVFDGGISNAERVVADLSRVNEAARQTADRLREVAELGERIASKNT